MAPQIRGVSPAQSVPLIVHVGRGGGRVFDAVAYCYGEGRGKDEPAYERPQGTRVVLPDGQSRVASVTGRIDGFNVTGDARLDASLLCALSGTRRGKKFDHVIVAALPGNELSAPEVARRYVDRFAPGANYIAIEHCDRAHAHVHILIERWNPALERRLDWRPSDLRRMQDVESWAPPGYVSGRRPEGAREPRRPSGKSSSNRDARREELLTDLRARLTQPGGREGLIAARELTMKTRTKSGGVLCRPGFSYQSESFRADTISKAGYGDIADLLGLPRQRIEKTQPEPSRLPKRARIGLSGQPLDFDRLASASRSDPSRKRGPAEPVKSLGALSKGTSVVSLGKDLAEVVTDPAAALPKLRVKVAEHVAEKALAGVVGSTSAGLLATGARLARGAALGEDAGTLAADAAKALLPVVVPAAAPIVTGIETAHTIIDTVAPPTVPPAPVQADADDDLATMTAPPKPTAAVPPPYMAASRKARAKKLRAERAASRLIRAQFDDSPGEEIHSAPPKPQAPKI